MNRCLNERALLRAYHREGTAAEHAHMRLCADCAERYEQVVEDLETIGQVLETPPMVSVTRQPLPWRMYWMPAAAAAALMTLVLGVAWLRPAPVEVTAHTSSVSAFAADLSEALFASADMNAMPQLAGEGQYLQAALEAGQPCTRDRFLTGECNDQLSALLIEEE